MAANYPAKETDAARAISDGDVEMVANDASYLHNAAIKSLSWTDVTVSVKAPKGGSQRKSQILSNVSGYVAAG